MSHPSRTIILLIGNAIDASFFISVIWSLLMVLPVLLLNFMEITECLMKAVHELFTEENVFKLERYCYASYNIFRDLGRRAASVIGK
jgi:hypothetical protein